MMAKAGTDWCDEVAAGWAERQRAYREESEEQESATGS